MTVRRHIGRAVRALPVLFVLAGPASADAAAKERTARAAALDACPAAATQPSGDNLQIVERTTLCLVNRERARRGIKRLDADGRLARSAGRYSSAMVRETFFSHVSPGGGTMLERIRRAGYLDGARGYTVGENLAWGSGRLATPIETVNAWMNSPGHKANILNRRFDEIGIGVAPGAPVSGVGNAATYTQHFGARS